MLDDGLIFTYHPTLFYCTRVAKRAKSEKTNLHYLRTGRFHKTLFIIKYCLIDIEIYQ